MPRNEFRTMNLPIADELAKRSGTRPRVRPQECAAYSIAGAIPKLVVSPRSLAEASKALGPLAAEGASIIIRGAGTKQWRPPHPYDVDVVLDATRCDGVLEPSPADLTVSVSASVRFADLQLALRAHGQFFPADPGFADRTTVGGMISSRSTGALRQRFGSARENVLGMRVCLSDGSVAFTGARVVKSVAGYDIHKLFTGAWGTLGLIGEVTLKVAPLPREERAAVAWYERSEDACQAAQAIASSSVFPYATTLHDRAAAHRIRAFGGASAQHAWTLVVRCGGARAAVARQFDAVCAAMRSHQASNVEAIDADRLHFAWQDIAELAGGSAYPGSQYVCLAVTGLPSQVPAVLAAVSAASPPAECTAHPSSGILFVHIPVADAAGSHEREDAQLAALAELGARERLSINYLAAPPAFARLRAPVPADSPVALMRRVKAAFDPSGTFDPGRFFAGT